MMEENFLTSKKVFNLCQDRAIPLMYASSAAVYGDGKIFQENPSCESPLNIYGYSKLLFDNWVRTRLNDLRAPVMGLRYFNVYGPKEAHKASMASVAYHFYNQLKNTGTIKLFEGCDGYAHGEQRRDFVYIDDVVDVNLWLMDHPQSGIYNLGTGKSQTFNDIAHAVLKWFADNRNQQGVLEYIPFPDHLKGAYQSFTQADISALRSVGFDKSFKTVEEGVVLYCEHLISQGY
jgi:ADP-L-glycero-D-manno-heptose 6-epimerase